METMSDPNVQRLEGFRDRLGVIGGEIESLRKEMETSSAANVEPDPGPPKLTILNEIDERLLQMQMDILNIRKHVMSQ